MSTSSKDPSGDTAGTYTTTSPAEPQDYLSNNVFLQKLIADHDSKTHYGTDFSDANYLKLDDNKKFLYKGAIEKFEVDYIRKNFIAIENNLLKGIIDQTFERIMVEKVLAPENQIYLNALYQVFPRIKDMIAAYGIVVDMKVTAFKEEGPDPVSRLQDEYMRAFGSGFKSAIGGKNPLDDMLQFVKDREDDPAPEPVNPWEMRIGAARFIVPPINIQVSQSFKSGSLTGGALRQQNSPKFNSGHSETAIAMTLYFPNHESIWGIGEADRLDIDFDKDDAVVVDRFISSLRGLITQFKYTPFLPVRNQFLNESFGITAVALHSMTISTIENFPFCLAVSLEMMNFNYKAYLPPVTDFNQAIHWGRYRQYVGRAAQKMAATVSEGFLIDTPYSDQLVDVALKTSVAEGTDVEVATQNVTKMESNPIIEFQKDREWQDGSNIEIYYPKRTPGKIFTADASGFRQVGEDRDYQQSKSAWDFFLKTVGINTDEHPEALYDVVQNANSSPFSPRDTQIIAEFLRAQQLNASNMTLEKRAEFVAKCLADQEDSLGRPLTPNEEEQVTNSARATWHYEQFMTYEQTPFFQKYLATAEFRNGAYTINEWEVPMEQMRIDPKNVIVDGVSVALANNIVQLQLQMQDEPVHQHIGGRDSTINISMTVFGEADLIRIRRVFGHVNGLARLEHAHGVLGFLGIRNVVTALAGIKYVLPLSFDVESIEGFPRVYRVNLSLVDFDIKQQKREELSSSQQKQLIDAFGKRNPFLRIKQLWGAFNAYPDFPLSIRDEQGDIVGHMEPDFYFKAYQMFDDDIVNWNLDEIKNRQEERAANKTRQLETVKATLDAAPASSGIGSTKNTYDSLQRLIDDPKTSEEKRQEYIVRRDSLLEQVADTDFDYEQVVNGVTYSPNSVFESRVLGTHMVNWNLGVIGDAQDKISMARLRNGAVDVGERTIGSDGSVAPFKSIVPAEKQTNQEAMTLRDSLAENALTNATIPDSTPYSDYTKAYADGSSDPTKQFQLMMTDTQYRDISGRMIRAFPTYMLWLIDEGGRFFGVKLFDNFYGLQSIIDFSMHSSEDVLGDTLVLRVSNLYQKLTTPYASLFGENSADGTAPKFAAADTLIRRQLNISSGTQDRFDVPLEHFRLKPGVRVHLRGGYGANPNSLQTMFNGTITSVEQGDIMEVIAQSDAIELSPYVNTANKKGHCLPPDVPIQLHSGETKKLGEIVRTKSDDFVLGVNEHGKIVPAKILNWFKNGTQDDWMDVALIDYTTNGRPRSIRVTSKHNVVLNGIYSPMATAKAGDIMTIVKNGLSHDIVHYIRSSLLGDGCICKYISSNEKASKTRPRYFYQESHTEKYPDFNTYVSECLGEAASNPIHRMSGKGSLMRQNSVSAHYDELITLYNEWYPNGIKVIPQDLSWVDDFTIAKWYMDDGWMNSGNKNQFAGFATNSFSYSDVVRLSNLLENRYEVSTSIREQNSNQYIITIKYNNGSIHNFWRAIAPYIIKCMRYKLPKEYCDVVDFSYPQGKIEQNLYDSKIISINSVTIPDTVQKRKKLFPHGRIGYDIQTSTGNYFANGILVHNSGKIDGALNTGLFLSEPRDLMVNLLSMGASRFKEAFAHATRGAIFSEGKFGIRHFGTILYDPLSPEEAEKHEKRYQLVKSSLDKLAGATSVGNFAGAGLDAFEDHNTKGETTKRGVDLFAGILTGNATSRVPVLAAMQNMWNNLYVNRDYELYKRNIYPGNGLGIAQYLGGDLGDGGLIMAMSYDNDGSTKNSVGTYNGREPYNLPKDMVLSNSLSLTAGARLVKEINDAKRPQPPPEENQQPEKSEPKKKKKGIWDKVGDAAGDVGGFVGDVTNATDIYGNIKSGDVGGLIGNVVDIALPGGDGILPIISPSDIVGVTGNVLTGKGTNPILEAMGVYGTDDDLDGMDEVSFRAQTYMKSVWDLFKVCAALLPNYIVAVRPFEDRSTVFYGKPHWMYTSGVIPISTGITPALGAKPSEPNDEERKQVNAVRNAANRFADFEAQLELFKTTSPASSNPNETTAGLPWQGGPEAYKHWPQNLNGDPRVVLPTQKCKVGAEMHLSTSKDHIGGHIQVAGLDPNNRWPRYMDKIGGGRGGEKGYDPDNEDVNAIGAGGGMQDYGEPVPYLVDGKKAKRISPEIEQYYMNMQFRDPVTGKKWGPPEIKAKYYGKKVYVYAHKTGRVCVCAIAEWGPADGLSVQAGLSPDAMYVLGIQHGDECSFGFADQSLPYGPTDGQGNTAPVSNEKVDGFDYTSDDPEENGRDGYRVREILSNEAIVGEGNEDKYKKLTTAQQLQKLFDVGWNNPMVPVWTSPTKEAIEGGVYDEIGIQSRRLYDKDYNETFSDAEAFKGKFLKNKGSIASGGRTLKQADRIWKEFRDKFRDLDEIKQILQSWVSDELIIDGEPFAGPGTAQRSVTEIDQIKKTAIEAFMRFMWQEPYARGWLVMVADRQYDSTPGPDLHNSDRQDWDFAKGNIGEGNDTVIEQALTKFLSLGLEAIETIDTRDTNGKFNSVNRGKILEWMGGRNIQGEDDAGRAGRLQNELSEKFDTTIGGVWKAISVTLQGVISTYRIGMMQLGQGLEQVHNMQKQANMLNRVFNDSIYYAAGSPGSILRLADNPFTREYGEPVVEIREPFQRVHYLSSDQHIISNGIRENLDGVATVVTAVSDGDYPVTVYFDKGMDPTRQVEISIETGIYWDNARGSGISGVLHPLLHPIETFRSLSKSATGSSDELLSRRIGLAHLKENLKDIYTGEVIILGNADIRPHDLVYLADLYSRMFGMFEVEQVVHTFAPDTGFITSITPNAIVTVNDPSRWAAVSWIWSWFGIKDVRDTTRRLLHSNQSEVSNLVVKQDNTISVEELATSLEPNLLGHTQYLQGNTALVKDLASAGALGLYGALDNAEAGIGPGPKGTIALLTMKFIPGFNLLSDLIWDGWKWVRDNLYDQHGCYIQYMNKDGEAMDAGISYSQGVAVGQHHSVTLLPGILGLDVDVIRNGNKRITINSQLTALGWREIDIDRLQRDVSWWVAQANAEVLQLSGRSPDGLGLMPFEDVELIWVTDIAGAEDGYFDGDTFHGRPVDENNPTFNPNTDPNLQTIREFRLAGLSSVETSQAIKDATKANAPLIRNRAENDLGTLAEAFLYKRLITDPQDGGYRPIVAVRRSPSPTTYGREAVVAFHNVPEGTDPEDRPRLLKEIASRWPIVAWDSYNAEGRPYTINWEAVTSGYSTVSLYNNQYDKGLGVQGLG